MKARQPEPLGWRLRNTPEKRKRLPEQLRATYGPVPTPERNQTYQLYNTIVAALEQLAKLASAGVVGSKSKYPSLAPSCLADVLTKSARKAVAVLGKAPDAPNAISWPLTFAITTTVRQFGDAVDRHPAQFQPQARQQVEWPVLRTIGSKGGKRDPFPALAEKISLGADAGIKRDGVIDFASVANRETVRCLLAISDFKKWALPPDRISPEGWASLEPCDKQLLTTEFPPLIRKPEVLQLYYRHGLKPLLDRDKAELLDDLVLARRKRNELLKRDADTPAVVWNDFLKACRDALEALAPPP